MPRFKDRIFYGWVVVATLFIVGTTFLGIRLSFGVFFKSIESEFGLTRAATSAIPSIYAMLAGVSAFFAGWTFDRYGPRIVILLMGLFTGLSLVLTGQTNSLWQLFITYSLLLSMGTGATFVVITSTVSRWFDRKKGMALGIASSGAGVGTVVMAPFATLLITNLDWRMAYLVIGLITWLIVIPLSRLLKRDPREIGALPDGVNSLSETVEDGGLSVQPTGLSLSLALRTGSFWLIMSVWALFGSSVFLLFTHLVPHVTDIGFSAEEAAAVLSLFGGSTIVGRVLVGVASDRIGRKLTSIICTLLQVGAMLWLVWSRDLWMLHIFALVYGFFNGGFRISMGTLISDTFGLRKIGVIFGVLEVGFGVGAAIGPAVGGIIFDISGSYSPAFLLSVTVMLISALLIALIRPETNGNYASG